MKIISVLLSLLVFLGPLPAIAGEAGLLEKTADYFIGTGDIINISVFPAEEFSKEVTVQPDGNIEIPMLGSIRAQGLRTDELQKNLTARFAKYVSNPSITLTVRKFSSSQVAVLGMVVSPGFYEYHEGMRLLDLVSLARGPQDYANTKKIRIYRRVNGGAGQFSDQLVDADFDAVFSGKMDKNITLSSGDIVYVPRKAYATGSKWISDNFAPWITLFTFVVTASIIARKN